MVDPAAGTVRAGMVGEPVEQVVVVREVVAMAVVELGRGSFFRRCLVWRRL